MDINFTKHYRIEQALEKNVFSIIWRDYAICLRFYGENMVNLIKRMVSMEIVGRQCAV